MHVAVLRDAVVNLTNLFRNPLIKSLIVYQPDKLFSILPPD